MGALEWTRIRQEINSQWLVNKHLRMAKLPDKRSQRGKIKNHSFKLTK